MIPYVEILTWNNTRTALRPMYIVEPSECWLELAYNEIGEFEIYAVANQNNLAALQKGNFVMIPHKNYVWEITTVQYLFNAGNARMISAKGKEAKCILQQRIIYTPCQLQSDLGAAIYALVRTACGAGAVSYRKIANLVVENQTLGVTLDSTQAPRANLADFVLELLKTYKCGAKMLWSAGNLVFTTHKGANRSASVIFAQSLDNLLSSTYFTSLDDYKNYCQDVATQTETVNNVQTTQESIVEYPDTPTSHPNTGIDRYEMTIQSSVSTKYTDAAGVEQETPFGSTLFKSFQTDEAKKALAEQKQAVEFDGEIDLSHSQYVFDVDFSVGDVVTIRDEWFSIEAAARITKYTFKQDAGGYQELAAYETD